MIALLSASTAAGWSFGTFLEGEWDLERAKGGELAHAHYSLKAVGGVLEGTYHEEGATADERTNEMRVRVEFDLAAPDTAGSFQLAKRQTPPADGEDPTPQPMGSDGFGPFKEMFEFDFSSRSDERFWISESRRATTRPYHAQRLTDAAP